jgi:pyruvate/2-oxoglutarate/acetoin dehydrogenase E1 component
MSGGQTDVPLVVRTNLGASGGKAAQHSQSPESWFVHTPGLLVAVPASPADAKGLLKTAIRDDNPVLFFEHKSLYFKKDFVPAGDDVLVPFGEARIWRTGSDVTVVASHAMLYHALAAAESLATEGIELEVIDPRTLVPLDIETILRSVERTNRLLVCHEAPTRGGWAAEVATQVIEQAFDALDAPVARVCGADVPVPYSGSLEPVVVPGTDRIVAQVRALVEGRAVRTAP